MRGLKKIAWEGDRQTYIHISIYKLTSRLYERIGLRADSLKITWEGDKEQRTNNGPTSRLLDRISPVGRLGENEILYKCGLTNTTYCTR